MPDLQQLSRDIAGNLDKHFPIEDAVVRQTMNMCEEVGEAAGAIRRYLKMARRNGTYEEVKEELADVIIATGILAHYLEIDIEKAIEEKSVKIFSRGWKNH